MRASIALLACVYSVGIAKTWAWERDIHGTSGFPIAEARAVVVDAEGNIVAAGRTRNALTQDDFTVVKLDGATGQVLWFQAINGTTNDTDQAYVVAVDAKGNVVAAGVTQNTGTGYDFAVIKFDGKNGGELWRRVIAGTGDYHDEPRALALDREGNVVAAGRIKTSEDSGEFAVIKLDGGSGRELWRINIHGTTNTLGDAFGVAADADGNVVATGWTENIETSQDFTVIKLDGGTGQGLWRRDVNGTLGYADVGRAIAVDPEGNVIAAGETHNTNTLVDFTVVKLDGTSGDEFWRYTLDGGTFIADSAVAVTVDAAGNAIAGGYIVPKAFDFTVVKLDGATGHELWHPILRGVTSAYDSARAVAVDRKGDVLVCGHITAAGPFGQVEFTTIKFEGSTGSELWRHTIPTSPDNSGIARAMALDSHGDVVIAGEVSFDFAVVKRRGLDGTDFLPELKIDRIELGMAGALLNLSGGLAGQAYQIQATTNLPTSSWQVIGLPTAGMDGHLQFLDTGASNHLMRFYRGATP